MFGWGVRKESRIVEKSFQPLLDAFMVQLDEIRKSNRIPLRAWNCWEVFAYVCWTYHIAIMNLGKTPSATHKLQVVLNNTANAYLFRRIMEEYADNTVEERKHKHETIMSSVAQRALDYNKAFNRDKVRSFDYSIPDTELGRYETGILVSKIASGTDMRRRLKRSSATLIVLVTQHKLQVFEALGLKVPTLN